MNVEMARIIQEWFSHLIKGFLLVTCLLIVSCSDSDTGPQPNVDPSPEPTATACGDEKIGKNCCCKSISGLDCRAVGAGCGVKFPTPIVMPVIDSGQ